MKLELLKKLTALANNNPNENEANLAARKVCLMLAECNFYLGIEVKEPKSKGPGAPFRSASNPTGPNPFWDFFTRAYGEDNPFSAGYQPNYKEPKPKLEKEYRRCDKCGTAYKVPLSSRGKPFICYNCHFDAKVVDIDDDTTKVKCRVCKKVFTEKNISSKDDYVCYDCYITIPPKAYEQ